MTSRDLVFWMNVIKASPSTEWCGYVPGYFPDNVISYSAPNPSTFVITFNKSYDPEWVLYNELSQIYSDAAGLGPDVAVAAGADAR